MGAPETFRWPFDTVSARARLRAEWLATGGLDHTEHDRRLRDRVARLLLVDAPSEAQLAIYSTADHLLTALDLPGVVYDRLKQDLAARLDRELQG